MVFVCPSGEVAVHPELRLGSSSLSGLLSLETAGVLLPGVNFLGLLFPSCLTELLVCLFGAEEAQLSVEQSKLPLFHAEPGKDQFTGDQWLERFEKCRQAGNWNEARTTSYFYNSMRGKALKWYRMLSVAKINANDYAQLRMAFVESYGTQASQRVVITDFMSIKQGKTEPVQEYFSRIGDTSYNYKVKKPNADIRGPCIVVPEDRREALAQYMALPLAVRQEVHELEYEQFNNNDVSYLGLQFFIAGLHPDIQLDVIKSGMSDLYEPFKIAHVCETAMASQFTVSFTNHLVQGCKRLHRFRNEIKKHS